MLNTKRVAIVQELLKMDEAPATIMYAIDIVTEAGAYDYSHSVHTQALKLIKKARKEAPDD